MVRSFLSVEWQPQIRRSRVFLAHSSCVWDVAPLSVLPHKALPDGSHGSEGAFATCSTDGSIRLWCLHFGYDMDEVVPGPVASQERPSNLYTKELLGVLYSGDFVIESKSKDLLLFICTTSPPSMV